MIIAKQLHQYNDSFVYFSEPIKNNVMNDSNFIRIIYSNSILTLTGIYFIINIPNMHCEKYYNKFRCIFNPNNYAELIEQIREIEDKLLQKLEITNKIPEYKIYEQLKSGNIKIFNDIPIKQNSTLILKISGIWETQTNYGVTYKFMKVVSYPDISKPLKK